MIRIRFLIMIIILVMANFAQITPSYGQGTAHPKTTIIRGFHLVSATEGWVWTDHLYWTKDSGKSWTDITPTTPTNMNIGAISFVDNRIGRAILSTKIEAGALPITYAIVQTSDGGKTWTTRPISLFSGQNLAETIPGQVSIQFLNAHTGWLRIKQMSGSGENTGTLFKTVDGGATWTKLSLPIASGSPIGDPVYFVTDQLGWIVGLPQADGRLYRTQDGGQTWQVQTVGGLTYGTDERFFELPQFVNARDGLLTITDQDGKTAKREIYITHDGGDSWKLDTSLDGHGPIKLIDNSHWIGVKTRMGLVRRTTSQATPPAILNQDPVVTNVVDMDFVSPNAALALSIYRTCPTPSKPAQCVTQYQLLYTNNGGQTWQLLSAPEIGSTALSTTIISETQGFDKACLPTVAEMQDWRNDNTMPYIAIGIYLVGPNEYSNCGSHSTSNPNLNAINLRNLSGQLNQQGDVGSGWKFFPIWFGPQGGPHGNAPLIGNDPTANPPKTYDLNFARQQGIEAANYAADAAVTLGLGGSVIYYDFEPFANTNYIAPAQALMVGWSSQLRARGFKAGVYGSAYTTYLGKFVDIASAPDVAWIAEWACSPQTNPPCSPNYYDATASVFGVGMTSNPPLQIGSNPPTWAAWPNHQRLHQYAADYPATYGVTKFPLIDSDAMDGVVAAQILIPGTPIIISPTQNGTLSSTNLTFVIQPGLPDYTGVMNWNLAVATDCNFSSVVFDYARQNNNQYSPNSSITIPQGTLIVGQNYCAEAIQGDGQIGGNPSATVTFSVVN